MVPPQKTMGPFLSVIVAAMLATFAIEQPPAGESVERGAAMFMAIGMVAAAWITSRQKRAQPGTLPRISAFSRIIDLVLYAALLFATDWPALCREAIGNLPLLRHLLLLAPYVFAALARIDAAWPAEEEGSRIWPRGKAVLFHARLLLIPIAPLLLIEGMHDLLGIIPGTRLLLAAYPVLDYTVLALLFVLTMLVMPRVLAWLVRSRPLQSPALRATLEGDLRRQGVTIGGIDEVDTGGLIPNAAYLGLTPRLGRIFITDALLRAMPADEIRAVFAHEVAHGTRRHLVWFLILFVSLIFSPYLVFSALPAPTWLEVPLALLPMILAMVVFVGVSRRFEVEADLCAAETLADPELFNRALSRVGAMSGRPIDRHGLRHYSVATRTAIVRACAADPATDAKWRQRIRQSKLGILGIALAIFAGVAWIASDDLVLSRARHRYFRAESAPCAHPFQDPGVDHDLREAITGARGFLGKPALRAQAAVVGVAASMKLADNMLAAGAFDEARRIAADVEANWPTGDPVGDFNRKMLRVELLAIDPAHDLASLRADVDLVAGEIRTLVETMGANASSDLVEEELRFLGAATAGRDAPFAFDPEAFESSRVLALARGASAGGAEFREAEIALRELPTDCAWRRVVLERALGAPAAEALKHLVATESRRGY